MAIYGIGLDLIKVERMGRLLERSSERTLRRLFTSREIEYCQKRRNSVPCLAMRFSAKEAFAKALGTGIGKSVGWKDVEVYPDDLGKPEIHPSEKLEKYLNKQGIISWHLSLTDDGAYGAAMVILEMRED